MTRLFLVIFIAFSIPIFSQSEYKPIKSHGKIPDDFLTDGLGLFDKLEKEINSKKLINLKNKKTDFLLYNALSINSLLKSGSVTFNDPISEYCGKILDKVLVNDTKLRKKVRVYTVKSTVANAFCTANGIIFVSTGLMAQVQNEAQLAFILSHEITHFTKEHHITGFAHKQEIIKKRRQYRTNEEKLDEYFSYSKEQEFEADEEGYKRYKETGYSINEIESTFDMLLYSYLPFDEEEFNFSYVESDYFIIPENLKLKHYNEITATEDYEDEESTHPNILKRKENIKELIKGNENGGKKYIISESTFQSVQKKARYELSYLYRITNNFEKSIYNSSLLLKNDPDSKYLKTNIAESIYGLLFYKNKTKFLSAHVKSKKIEGYSQQVNYFFEEIDKDALNLLGLNYAWRLRNEYPGDKYIKLLSDSVLVQATHNISFPLTELPLKTSELIISDDNVDLSKLSKTEKIKHRKKQTTKKLSSGKYYYNALMGLADTDILFEQYNKVKKGIDKKELTPKEKKAIRNKENEMDDKIEKYGHSLGIDSIGMFPLYYQYDLGKVSVNRIKKHKSQKIKFAKKMSSSAKKIDLEINYLDISGLKKNDLDRFNNFALLTTWFYESYFQPENDFVLGTQQYLYDINDYIDMNYYAWPIMRNIGSWHQYTIFLFEMHTGNLVYKYQEQLPGMRSDITKSNLYYSLLQIKRKQKEK